MASPALMTTPLGAWSNKRRATGFGGANRLEWSSQQLRGEEGADRIIAEIKQRKPLVALVLGHNPLGDVGCARLLEFLSADTRQHKALQEIALNSTSLNSRSLVNIAGYLRDNIGLQELQLQNNMLSADEDAWKVFTAALNRSHLRRLLLSTNELGDAFANVFFGALETPFFEELNLSLVGLTGAAVPALVDFLCSPRARALRHLTLNGNMIDYPALLELVNAIENSNFGLTRCELFANRGTDDSSEERAARQATLLRLANATTRNKVFMEDVGHEAFDLLRHARTVLLQRRHVNQETVSGPHFPTEIMLHILSYISPMLSTAQQLRVIEYASDPKTLPSTSIELPVLGSDEAEPLRQAIINGAPYVSLLVQTELRLRWLNKVGCDYYERKN